MSKNKTPLRLGAKRLAIRGEKSEKKAKGQTVTRRDLECECICRSFAVLLRAACYRLPLARQSAIEEGKDKSSWCRIHISALQLRKQGPTSDMRDSFCKLSPAGTIRSTAVRALVLLDWLIEQLRPVGVQKKFDCRLNSSHTSVRMDCMSRHTEF